MGTSPSAPSCVMCGSASDLEAAAGGKLYCATCRTDLAPGGTIECGCCFDDVPVDQSLPLCAERHRFCAECCWRCCQSALSDGLVPACPNDKASKCGHISKAIAERALSFWLLAEKGQMQSRKAELGSSWVIRGSKAAGFTSGKVDDIYLNAQRAAQGAVQCPGRKCKAWYVPPVPHSTRPQRLVCTVDKCATSFCSACRHPYHFRTDCAEALRINARWIKFLQEDFAPFLMAAVKVAPERYSAALKEHSKSKGALDDATKEALSRFDELKKMELWKEKYACTPRATHLLICLPPLCLRSHSQQ
jgi:hypothetical protein